MFLFFNFFCFIFFTLEQTLNNESTRGHLHLFFAAGQLAFTFHIIPLQLLLNSPCYIAGNHNLSMCFSHLVPTVCCSAQHCPHSVWTCMTFRSGRVMNIEFRQRAASFSSGFLLGVEHNWASAYKCARAHTHTHAVSLCLVCMVAPCSSSECVSAHWQTKQLLKVASLVFLWAWTVSSEPILNQTELLIRAPRWLVGLDQR